MTTNQSPKLLRRSTDDKWIAGVCSGVARYVGVDVVLVRLVLLVLTVFSFGVGMLAYLVAWIVMPADTAAAAAPNSTPWASGSSVE
jgi:phage shock protein C